MATVMIDYLLPTEAVASYADWKEVFDTDPIGRKAHGATGHRIIRDAADANHFVLAIEFPIRDQARAFVDACGDMGFTGARQTWILEASESITY
jgi:hypothetical protein